MATGAGAEKAGGGLELIAAGGDAVGWSEARDASTDAALAVEETVGWPVAAALQAETERQRSPSPVIRNRRHLPASILLAT